MTDEHISEPPIAPEAMTIFTPANIVLLALALYLVYIRLKPTTVPAFPATEAIVYETFTPITLQPYNGADNPRILMGVKGKVFDVTPGKGFYGPGGPYGVFAGRDASRGLSKGNLDESLLTPVGQKLDTLETLTKDEIEALQGWIEQFQGKYLEVGKLVNEDGTPYNS